MFASVWTRFEPSLAAAQPLPSARDTRQEQMVRMLARLGLAGLLVGGVGFAFTYGALDPALGRQVARLWPLLLVLVGIGLVIQFLAQRKQ